MKSLNKQQRTDGFGDTHFVPLTDTDLIYLGKITSLFAAMETNMDVIVMRLAEINNYHTLESLYSGGQFGAKIGLIKNLVKREPDAVFKNLIIEACCKLDGITSDRNHAIHGRWGFMTTELITKNFTAQTVVAAISYKKPLKALLASDLPNLFARTEISAKSTHAASSYPLKGLQIPTEYTFYQGPRP